MVMATPIISLKETFFRADDISCVWLGHCDHSVNVELNGSPEPHEILFESIDVARSEMAVFIAHWREAVSE